MAITPSREIAARVVVHERAHIRAALATAAATKRTIILVSGPAVGGAMGGPWFRYMVADIAALYPQARFTTVIDCGTAAGFALAALAGGAAAIRLHAPPLVLERVRDIARQSGAVIDLDTNPMLDLLFHSDPVAACHAWLKAS
ncbi:hypothetical protein RIEGSTA812A_PEG_722 [invertebrate metagenome]|uniref:Uncharacterized protein n=1 Tax=invertebrate metagenome TaxID=1711999 RepID=A0A484H5K3_9ZZZZ